MCQLKYTFITRWTLSINKTDDKNITNLMLWYRNGRWSGQSSRRHTGGQYDQVDNTNMVGHHLNRFKCSKYCCFYRINSYRRDSIYICYLYFIVIYSRVFGHPIIKALYKKITQFWFWQRPFFANNSFALKTIRNWKNTKTKTRIYASASQPSWYTLLITACIPTFAATKVIIIIPALASSYCWVEREF